jgi:hypothetical protein
MSEYESLGYITANWQSRRYVSTRPFGPGRPHAEFADSPDLLHDSSSLKCFISLACSASVPEQVAADACHLSIPKWFLAAVENLTQDLERDVEAGMSTSLRVCRALLTSDSTSLLVHVLVTIKRIRASGFPCGASSTAIREPS